MEKMAKCNGGKRIALNIISGWPDEHFLFIKSRFDFYRNIYFY